MKLGATIPVTPLPSEELEQDALDVLSPTVLELEDEDELEEPDELVVITSDEDEDVTDARVEDDDSDVVDAEEMDVVEALELDRLVDVDVFDATVLDDEENNNTPVDVDEDDVEQLSLVRLARVDEDEDVFPSCVDRLVSDALDSEVLLADVVEQLTELVHSGLLSDVLETLVVVAELFVDDDDVDTLELDRLVSLVRLVDVVVSETSVLLDKDEELDCCEGGSNSISTADSPRRNTSLWMVSRPCQSVT